MHPNNWAEQKWLPTGCPTFRPETEDELVEAIDGYGVRSPGLGADFSVC
jgi:hypothetical protein